jgi:ribosome-binding protein aMBF1 (putative translation factor)
MTAADRLTPLDALSGLSVILRMPHIPNCRHQFGRNYSSQTRALSTGTLFSVFAELLRKARNDAGLTQEELAQKVKLTREYISLLEHGKRLPTILVFMRLARALGTSPAELIEKLERRMVRK